MAGKEGRGMRASSSVSVRKGAAEALLDERALPWMKASEVCRALVFCGDVKVMFFDLTGAEDCVVYAPVAAAVRRLPA